jgi:hypothetical protein
MERHEVDDNKDRTCSSGLHFCSKDYLNSFGGERVVIVKINPRDVVSIPSDYNDTKGRACRYEVVGEIDADKAPESAFTQSVQSNAYVHRTMKTGTSAFYKGYTAGFTGIYNASDDHYGKERLDYREGYEKGSKDRYSGTERYRYIAPIQVDGGAWPFAKGQS